MKPDSTRAAIVEAIRKAGASWVDVEGRAGTPDGVWGFQGRCGFAEIKRQGKGGGICGCDLTDPRLCSQALSEAHDVGFNCSCRGHIGTGNAERTTWHKQLAFREAWKGPPVSIWTTPEEALKTIGVKP